MLKQNNLYSIATVHFKLTYDIISKLLKALLTEDLFS